MLNVQYDSIDLSRLIDVDSVDYKEMIELYIILVFLLFDRYDKRRL